MSEHVIVKNVTVDGKGCYLLRCNNCKKQELPELPIPMNEFLSLMQNFSDDHENCEPKVKEVEATGWG